MEINPALQFVTEVKETTDIKEVAQLLSTGEWIATCATSTEPYLFALGKIKPQFTVFKTSPGTFTSPLDDGQPKE